MPMSQDMQISESLKNEFFIAIKDNQIQDVKELLDKDKRLVEVKLEGDLDALELAISLGFHELILLLRPYYNNEQVQEIKDENEAKWYLDGSITNLVCCQQKKVPLLRYVFSYSGDDNPRKQFMNQFQQLIALKNKFKVPAYFIAMRPGTTISSHFIVGIIIDDKLIIINPLGEEKQQDFYKVLFKLRDLGYVKSFSLSNTVIQHDLGGIISCGPICVERNYSPPSNENIFLKTLDTYF